MLHLRKQDTPSRIGTLFIFPSLFSYTRPTISDILSLRNQLYRMIKMFSAGLVVPFIWYSSGNYVAGSGFGLCSKVHVLLMRTHNTAVFSLHLKVFKVLPSWGFALGIVLLYIRKPLQLPVSGIWTGIMILIPSRASLDWAWTHADQRLGQSRHWLRETWKHQTRINAA